MAKMKIGFDVDGDYAWNNLLYRNLIKDLVANAAELEVYLITQNTDATYITDVQNQLGLDVNHVFMVTSNSAVQGLLTQYNINIYLCTDNELCKLINDNIPFTNTNNIISGCQAILVNSIPDIYKSQPKYITFLQFWINEYNKTQVSEENC